MNENQINKAYELAKERYAAIGVDTEKVLATLQDFHLSMHCWQADDVKGFEVQAGALSGGIQSTGDFPGAARNIDELRADILKAKSLIPGTHRLNLHEIYGDFQGKVVDRDEVTVDYFKSWIDWGKENNTKLDFNSTSFSHPKSGNLSLSNPDKGIRDFWIEHTKRCRDIDDEMGKAQEDPCIMNLWVHDGCKDVSVNHMLYRHLLKESLDEIFSEKKENMKDCLEGKVFGIGLESFTVGSHDFYTAYCSKNNIIQTCFTYPVLYVGIPTMSQSWTTTPRSSSSRLFAQVLLTAFTTVSTTSTDQSTESVLTSSVHVQLRSACSELSLSRRRLSPSTNLKVAATRSSPSSKRQRLCLGLPFTTSSVCATASLWVKHSSQRSISTRRKSLQRDSS